MSEKKQYPIGTLVYYGPDDQTVTKITASVIRYQGAKPVRHSWTGDRVAVDPQVAVELGQFYKGYGVQKVVMSDKIEGCPHVEGEDYPAGQDCPYCPFWASKDKDQLSNDAPTAS